MHRLFALVILLVPLAIVGCDDGSKDREISKLNTQLQAALRQQREMEKTLPSEQPEVLKENAKLRVELIATKQALAASSERIPGEILPLAIWLKELQKRLDAVEPLARGASRKGAHAQLQEGRLIPLEHHES
jgi:hypothetical protein